MVPHSNQHPSLVLPPDSWFACLVILPNLDQWTWKKTPCTFFLDQVFVTKDVDQDFSCDTDKSDYFHANRKKISKRTTRIKDLRFLSALSLWKSSEPSGLSNHCADCTSVISRCIWRNQNGQTHWNAYDLLHLSDHWIYFNSGDVFPLGLICIERAPELTGICHSHCVIHNSLACIRHTFCTG